MINAVLLKEQLKRFWAVSALGILGYVFMVLLPVHQSFGNEQYWITNNLLSGVFTLSVASGSFAVLFMILLIPLVAVFCVKGMFNQKNSATYFYSLPMNKRQLFCTNALAGVILCVIPLVIFSLTLLYPVEFHNIERMWINEREVDMVARLFPPVLFPGGVVNGGVINTPAAVGIFFLRALIVTLFYFGVAWLAFSMAGNGIIALLLSAAIPLLVLILPPALGGVATGYVFGFVSNDIMWESFWMFTSPIGWGSWHPETTGQLLARFVNYIVLGAAIFVGAYILSKLRKPERTGNSVVFVPVKNVFIFILSLGSMIIIGAVFWEFFGGYFMIYPGFVVGFALGYIIAQMIAEKSFNVIVKLRQLPGYGAVAVCMYVVMLLVTQFGMNGYINHVPERNEIVGVHVGSWNMLWYDPEQSQELFVTDGATIDQTLAVHRNILANRGNLHVLPAQSPNIVPLDEDGRRIWNIHSVNYLFADGSIMARSYLVPNEYEVSLGLDALLGSEPMLLVGHALLSRPEMIHDIRVEQTVWSVEGVHDSTVFHHVTGTLNILVSDEEAIRELAGFMTEMILARGRDHRLDLWTASRLNRADAAIETIEETTIRADVDWNLPGAHRLGWSHLSLDADETALLLELLRELGELENERND